MNSMKKHIIAFFSCLLMLNSTVLADTNIQRKDAVSALLDSIGRAGIPGMQNALRNFDDADVLPEELRDDYSRAVNYAIVRRMGNNNLDPDAVLTRAELLTMVSWAAESRMENSDSEEAAFTDLPDWSITPISQLADAGWLDLYMTGDLACGDGILDADKPATQEELDYYAARLTELYDCRG